MSNLLVRILVAIVAIPLIVFFSMSGGFYFFGLVLLISVVGLHEYYKLAKAKGASPLTIPGLLLGVAITSMFFWQTINSHLPADMQLAAPGSMFIVLLLVFVSLLLLIELFRNRGSAIVNLSTTLFGVWYVSFFLGSLIGLRELFAPDAIRSPVESAQLTYDLGGMLVVTLFVSIWMCDSLAYFTGRFFGRHKLFERVSPNKTWEGASAGYVGAVAAFLIAQYYFLPFLTLGNAFVCGSIVGIFGQLGDLVESLLKRDAAVKDSSAVIPGHGGVLDRFDSLIFVSPLMFLYLNFIVF